MKCGRTTANCCAMLVAAAVAFVPGEVAAQMKWMPQVTAKKGELHLSGKDVVFSTGYPSSSVSVATLVGRVDTLVTDVEEVRSAALSSSTVDTMIEAAVTGVITEKITASNTRAQEKRNSLDQKITLLSQDIGGKSAQNKAVAAQNKAELAELKEELADAKGKLATVTSEVNALKASTGTANWVGHFTNTACLSIAGGVQADFVVAGHGFVPNVAYTLKLSLGSRVVATKLAAKLSADLSDVSTLTFDSNLLYKAWGSKSEVQLEVLDDQNKVVPYGGKSRGNLVKIEAPKSDSLKMCPSANCAGFGLSAAKPALNCGHILTTCPDAPTGEYYVTMNGQYGGGIEARCDMKTDKGGWTLFGTKKGARSNTIPVNVGKIDTKCYKNTGGDCQGLVPKTAKWTEVMFRFEKYDNEYSDRSASNYGNGKALTFLVWRRGLSDARALNTLFEEMFIYGHRNRGDPGGKRVCGFYKSTKGKGKGERTSSRPHCVNLMHFHNGGTISERHQASNGGSDQWIDMWNSVDNDGNNYDDVNADGGNPRGMKCIAGVCHYKDPINLYFR